GPAWLAAPGDGSDLYQTAREQIDFLVRVHELERIVLITHFGCAYYGHRLRKAPKECVPAQAEDVRTAKAALRRWYPDIGVETYLAMRHGNVLSFHRLDD